MVVILQQLRLISTRCDCVFFLFSCFVTRVEMIPMLNCLLCTRRNPVDDDVEANPVASLTGSKSLWYQGGNNKQHRRQTRNGNDPNLA